MAEKNKSFIPPKGKRPKFSFYWIYALLLIVFIAIQYFNYSNPVKETSWPRLEEMLIKQDVEKIIVVNKEKAEIYIKKAKLKSDTAYKDFSKRASDHLQEEPLRSFSIRLDLKRSSMDC